MAGQKLTALTTTQTLADDDLVYVVTDISTTPTSKGIAKADLVADIGTSPVATNPVENSYLTIAEMLADQANQTATFFQYVLDDGTGSEAYYEKLSTTSANIADYRKLSDTETEIIRDSNSYRVFRIEAIQDDGTPLTTVSGGRISFEYSGTDVTAILFNSRYTDAIEEFYNKDVNVRFYNRTTRKYQTESIGSGAWTTVNTNFYRGAVTGTNIQISDLTVDDRVEFFMLEASGGQVNTINSITAGEPAGSDVVSNVVSLTQAEYDAGTPVAGTFYVITDAVETVVLSMACSDETTDLAVATSVYTFRMPFAMTLTGVKASVNTAPTGSTITVDINESAVSVLSTKLTIDATEKTSTTATTPAVISDSNLADDSEITIDIDQVGSTITGAGLKLTLYGTTV